VEAKDLLVGDVFLGVNGELSTLTNVVRIEQDDRINVFNLAIDGNHNYFILAKEYEYGQTCVLVHNADPGFGICPGDFDDAGDWTPGKRRDARLNALKHFKDHRVDFPEIDNVDEYIDLAHEFRELAPEMKVTELGKFAFFDEITERVLITEPDGTPCTFFKPEFPRAFFETL